MTNAARSTPPDRHTRHTSSVALVLIDVVNHFEFPDGDKILKRALPMAAPLSRLKQRCRSAGIPVILRQRQFRSMAFRREDAKLRLVCALCTAARSRREHEQAIEHIKEMTCASVIPSTKLRVDALRRASRHHNKLKT
jgi:hypothetical protein